MRRTSTDTGADKVRRAVKGDAGATNPQGATGGNRCRQHGAGTSGSNRANWSNWSNWSDRPDWTNGSSQHGTGSANIRADFRYAAGWRTG